MFLYFVAITGTHQEWNAGKDLEMFAGGGGVRPVRFVHGKNHNVQYAFKPVSHSQSSPCIQPSFFLLYISFLLSEQGGGVSIPPPWICV